jgi:hypothetical protein
MAANLASWDRPTWCGVQDHSSGTTSMNVPIAHDATPIMTHAERLYRGDRGERERTEAERRGRGAQQHRGAGGWRTA